MNAFARSQTWMNTPLNVGIWYAGNSITNGAGSPAKKRVFFNAIPDKIITKILKKYIAGAIQVLPGKNAELIIPIITVFAPQGINVHNRIVILLSASFSIVRVPITAGTPHPVPIKIGMNDLPDKPNLRNNLSIMKAILAIYPESSRIAKNKKISAICGTKPNTVPTPPIIPSLIKLINGAAQPIDLRKVSTAGGIISVNNTSFTQSVIQLPTVDTEM